MGRRFGGIELVHCPECGKEQPDEMKFCRHCGDRLPGGTEVRRLREEAAAIAQIRASDGSSSGQPSGAINPTLGPAPQVNQQGQMGEHPSSDAVPTPAGQSPTAPTGAPFQTGQPLRRG